MIYFAQTATGSIKIGTTEDVDGRMDTLASHYGASLALLATMPDGKPEEQEIHERFAHHRIRRTEQFRPGADLLEFIGKPLLVNANPEAVEAHPSRLNGFKGIRLDLSPADHKRLERCAKDRGLTMASYARMALFQQLKADEGGAK
jgi:hypothetical protein